jgi:AraC-like DNA-binding protein
MRNHYECSLRDLLIAQLRKASPMPTFVTLPREQRALAVARMIMRNPAESKSMAALCAQAGVSVRTIERTFQKDVGISFELWRRQVRLKKAVELLVSGDSIKEVAFNVGYSQPSAFVDMFRKTFGTTPKAWITSLDTAASRRTEKA